MPHDRSRVCVAGFTLVEMLVVIVLMMVAAGIVAPAFVPRQPETSEADLARLVRSARAAAAAREETLFVRLSTSGAWRIEGAGADGGGDVVTGTLSAYTGPAGTIVVSPLGTCAFDVRSTAGAVAIPLDPMTCEVLGP